MTKYVSLNNPSSLDPTHQDFDSTGSGIALQHHDTGEIRGHYNDLPCFWRDTDIDWIGKP